MTGSVRPSAAAAAVGLLAVVGVGLWFAARAVGRSRHQLRDKVVLVTGASRGLGLEIARQIGARGARVAICARNRAELARAEADLLSRGIPVLAEACDVTHPGEVLELVARVQARWGPVDVLVNNAGRINVGPLEHATEADHRSAMDLHYWGPLRAIEAVLPEMRRRKRGHLVNIVSIGGVIPVPHMLAYTASKHALLGLSRGYQVELARQGITVTTVIPGLVRTGSARNATFKGHHRAEYTWFALGDGLPLVSVPVRRAARTIRRAIENGRTEVVVGLPAKATRLGYALAPRLAQRVLAAFARLLPEPGGVGENGRLGSASETAVTRSPLMAFGRRAERTQHQIK